ALAVLPPLALRIRGRDPEQCLAVAPAREAAAIMLELEAEEAENFVVKILRARQIADAQDQMIDTDDVGHEVPMALVGSSSGRISANAHMMSSLASFALEAAVRARPHQHGAAVARPEN